jgi:16S rRNA (guanine(966)-N(2))-methyltransferase RsmD
MRIIAGKFRGRKLKSPPSLEVRPTSDRLRETLFNIIAPGIENTRFLDLCAGSGAVGIEALSRGARYVTFVDRSKAMCDLIKSNLELCRIEKVWNEVINAEALPYLRRANRQLSRPAEGRRTQDDLWDIAFFDPPYDSDYLPILKTFGAPESGLLSENGLLIIEHHHKNELPATVGKLHCTRILKQGDSSLSFYKVNAA